MTWEETFRSWAKPPGQTEQTKCDNAVRAVRKAIESSSALAERGISVFSQGSYCNRTNVRIESDVDVCALCDDTLYFEVPNGADSKDFVQTTPATYQYSQYKSDLGVALNNYFGAKGVTPGKKAFDIHENTYRVDADVIPCFEYRWYWENRRCQLGTAFVPNGGSRIVNWPRQNYENGVSKNNETAGRFKDLTRILKRLKYEMMDENIASASPIPSYLIECLIWNVPKEGFGHDTLWEDMRWGLAHLFNKTLNVVDCQDWGEVNEFKYLFRSSQPWTLIQAHDFLSSAWDYIGFQ